MNKLVTKNNLLLGLLLAFATILLLYKLNYESFFTDEILYTDSGNEYFHGDYTMNLQHPFITKYIAGFMMQFTQRDTFVLRMPFAILGVIAVYLVFLILKEFVENKYSLLGGLLYVLMPFIFDSTRMVMMESPMHLFWLFFHLMFIRFLKTEKLKYAVLSGIFIGLGMGTKFPTIIMYPFSVIILIVFSRLNKKVSLTSMFKKLLLAFAISGLTYAFTYIILFLKDGINGLIRVAQTTKDVFIGRNEEGKTHVVGDQIFNKSPWWYYLYFISKKYVPVQLILAIISPIFAIIEKSFYAIYWLLFFILTTLFFQLLPLKNERYISSIELSLVFLIVIALRYFIEKYCKNSKIKLGLIYGLIFSIVTARVAYSINIVPTKYYALEKFLLERTNNFTNVDRTYIMGSIRSSRWQFEYAPEDKIVSRKDFDIMYPEFPNFKYIVFDNNELLKNPSNDLYRFVKYNIQYYDLEKLPGLDVYVRKEGELSPLKK